MLENTNEQGLVSLTVPPVNWDLSMEGLRNPDIQLTVKDKVKKVISLQTFQIAWILSSCSFQGTS